MMFAALLLRAFSFVTRHMTVFYNGRTLIFGNNVKTLMPSMNCSSPAWKDPSSVTKNHLLSILTIESSAVILVYKRRIFGAHTQMGLDCTGDQI